MKILPLLLLLLALASFRPDAAGAAEENPVRELYLVRCAMCHGENGQPRGIAKGSVSFTDPAWKESVSVEQVEMIIAKGRKKMPGFSSKLTAEEIRSLADYVLAMQ